MTLASLLSARTPIAAQPGIPATSTPGITINTLQITQNIHGARLKTWVTKYTNIPARIVDASSDVQVFFERNGMQVSHVVYVGDPGGGAVTLQITQGEQIQFGNRVFEIQGVMNPDHLNRYLKLVCLEKTPGLAAAAFPQP